jgi:DNA invertase Pin-like site-specific DNA recombinase
MMWFHNPRWKTGCSLPRVMTMAIWGYARGEYAGGATIGEQRRRIKAYAIGQNMKLERVVIEQRGVRAYTPVADRPIGGPLFEKLVKGDIVIVALLDRLFGSAVDALKVVADLESRGVGLHILDLAEAGPPATPTTTTTAASRRRLREEGR